MNKLNCEITRDLIPSYLDGICSNSSREAIEYHLMGCRECREHLELLQNTELSAQKTDQQQLRFMKKVKLHFTLKNGMGVVLLFILSLAVLLIVPEIQLGIALELYCALFTILTLGTFLLLSNYQEKPKWSRLRIAAAVVSILGILCSIGISALVLHMLDTRSGFLGIPLEKAGPFLNWTLLCILFIELFIFAGYAVDSIRGEHSFGILPTLNLAGCILCMSYRSFLFLMDSRDTLELAMWDITLIVFLITCCVILAELIVTKIRRCLRLK